MTESATVDLVDVDLVFDHQRIEDITGELANSVGTTVPLTLAGNDWMLADPAGFLSEPLDGTWTLTLQDTVRGFRGILAVEVMPLALSRVAIQTRHRLDADELLTESVTPLHAEVGLALITPPVRNVRAVDDFMTDYGQEQEPNAKQDPWVEEVPWETLETMQYRTSLLA